VVTTAAEEVEVVWTFWWLDGGMEAVIGGSMCGARKPGGGRVTREVFCSSRYTKTNIIEKI